MAIIPVGTKFIGIDASVPTSPERNGRRINDKAEHYTVDDIAAFVGVGSEGPQGIQGPSGPPGPVGPAGLEWQGAWDTDSQYAVNDAVGFDGASYFCILEITGTGNDNPESNTANWALLASQGADGPQGAQGPTGPQGPQGVAPVKTKGFVYGSGVSYFEQVVLPHDINVVFDGSEGSSFKLPDTTVAGKEVIVDIMGNNSCTFYGFTGGLAFETAVNGTSGQIVAAFNDLIKFTSLGGNFWLVQYLPRVYPKLNGKNLVAQNAVYTLTTNNTTSPLNLAALNASYTNSSTILDFKVFCPNITGGGLVYIKTGISTWVSQAITAVS